MAKAQKKPQATKTAWHYPREGDYPEIDKSVIVYVADMGDWGKKVVTAAKESTIGMYQQNSRYKGKAGGTVIDVWDGVPFHGAVVAWRDAGATPDGEKIKDAVLDFQKLVTTGANLRYFLASVYVVDPRKNEVYITGLEKKFRRNEKEITADGLVNHLGGEKQAATIPVYQAEDGRKFTVEYLYRHGVIVQIDKPGARSRYAFAYPGKKKVFANEREAALALIAEAERQKWRRCG